MLIQRTPGYEIYASIQEISIGTFRLAFTTRKLEKDGQYSDSNYETYLDIDGIKSLVSVLMSIRKQEGT